MSDDDEIEDQEIEQEIEDEEEVIVDNEESEEEVIEEDNEHEENEKHKIVQEEVRKKEDKITEEEHEEQVNAEDVSRIKDLNVLKLMKINLQSTDKESIINILMKNNALETKTQNDKNRDQQYSKDKTKKRLTNRGTFTKNREDGELKYAKTDKYHIFQKEDDPHFTSDFNVATQKVISQLANEKDSELMKILFADEFMKKNVHSELTRDQISQKVNMALNKKQEEIDKLASRWNQEYNEKHTFAPQLISQQIGQERRNFNQFLEDQKNHQKKVNDKIETLKLKEKENESKKANNKPTIDKNSQILYQNILKTDEPVYDRLFNKKYQTSKTTLLKDKDKNNEKEEVKEKKKKKLSVQKKTITLDQDNEAQVKKQKKKEENSLISQKPAIKAEDLYGNDILLKNFVAHYDEVSAAYCPTPQESNEPLKKVKINLQQIHSLISSLGMCSPEKMDNSYIENQLEESALQLKEKELIEEIWNTLKDADSEVNTDHLKQFLICILNLHLYSLYKEYTKSHSTEEIKKLMSLSDEKINENNNLKEILIDIILKEANKQIISKIDKTKPSKYISFDTSGNILIPLNKSKMIKKDFNLFYITYMSNRPKPQYKKEKETKEVLSFKPIINNNSEKMYKNYRAKLGKEENEQDNEQNKKQLEYIDKIIMKRKKKIAENIRQKEENEKRELDQCTFKPRTNNFLITKTTGANRFNELFHKGSEKEKNRRDKTIEDYEMEKIKECTFIPKIYKSSLDDEDIPKTHFTNDIINEHSYKLHYERLRNGRMEHLIRQAVHERFALNNVLQDYINKNKEGDQYEQSNTVSELKTSQHSIGNESDNTKPKSFVGDTDINVNPVIVNPSPEDDIDPKDQRKESIPLLIIDVNIRQGVKKKIFVYEGDTAVELSDKFAAEHNLEAQTKEKLRNLIHNHIQKLLSVIKEENHSISEKSSANHNQQSS